MFSICNKTIASLKTKGLQCAEEIKTTTTPHAGTTDWLRVLDFQKKKKNSVGRITASEILSQLPCRLCCIGPAFYSQGNHPTLNSNHNLLVWIFRF